MKKVIIPLFIIVTLLIINSSEYVVIPYDSVRLRIIPSSNNPEDVFVKERLTEELVSLLNSVNSKEEIKSIVPKVEQKVKEVFKKYDYDENYTISYGSNYFPKKIYKDVLYDEGYYESLVVTIGKGKGSNFWCVLFPPLCNLEVDNTEDVTYKFKVKEIIDSFLNKI